MVAAAVSLGLTFLLLKSRRNYKRLPVLPVTARVLPADVSVIIPARDEEANIADAVASFPKGIAYVVDDGSTDSTVEVARDAGARVIHAPPLLRGMIGRANACQAGAKATESEWLLFVDADTSYKPEFLPSLMEYAQAENLDVVSCFLREQRVTWAERIVQPYCLARYFCGVDAANVNSPKSMEALANGQCMLFRRSAYRFIGGHAAVASNVVDALGLAVIVKRHRIRQRIMRAEHLGTVRMREGPGGMWRRFERNAFRLKLLSRWTRAQIVVSSILLMSYLPVLGILLWEEQFVAAAAFALIPVVLLFPWYGSFSAILAPVAIYLLPLFVLAGMVATVHGKKAVWKGRRI